MSPLLLVILSPVLNTPSEPLVPDPPIGTEIKPSEFTLILSPILTRPFAVLEASTICCKELKNNHLPGVSEDGSLGSGSRNIHISG